MSDVVVIKSDGKEETFSEEKLIRSLRKSGASDIEISNTVAYIKKKIRPGITTGEIYALAFKELNSHRKRNPNAIRYSLKKGIMELGPSGFPFEKFVARIFNALGYTTHTGVTIQGHCIEHEVDVFAHNDTDVICIEAKFHNEPHLRSDTKVALYVKSRIDDLKGQKIKIGEEYRHITRGMLVTNTNFTDTAHQYVSCTGAYELMSWNRPADKNLLSYIEEFKLYPIGLVPELSRKEIDMLVEKDILTCADLNAKPEVLDEIEIRKSKQEVIMDTIREICKS
ncbi:MAG: hypothetical protein RLY49_436 [Candidatus Parcubacteria bacterium]|jgi:hypothetical protein